jgi:hypothetical protein
MLNMDDPRENTYIKQQQHIEHLQDSLNQFRNKCKPYKSQLLQQQIQNVLRDLDIQKRYNFTQYCQYDLIAESPVDMVIENIALKSQIEDLEADVKKWTLDMERQPSMIGGWKACTCKNDGCSKIHEDGQMGSWHKKRGQLIETEFEAHCDRSSHYP